MPTKEQIKQHWETETAGVRYGEGEDTEGFYRSIEHARYLLEPYVPFFAQFDDYAGKRVLEVGIGGGVDFSQFVRHGALVTPFRAIERSELYSPLRTCSPVQ